MEELSNKTVMCSVLFLDIVEYSKKSVAGQIALKEAFNSMLSNAIRDVPSNDRVILDTGDGAAISFLGDVEDALKAALLLRDSLLSEGAQMDPTLLVRIGINLGPVRIVKDINGRPNIVGDGINVAQRVMGFANPGQILVSRSYFDAVSRLSQEYAGMFHSEGSRTDKHVREHEVYAIGYPGDLTAAQQKSGNIEEPAAAKKAPAEGVGGLVQNAQSALKKTSGTQRAIYIGVAGVLLGLLAAVLVASRPPDLPKPEVVVEAPVKPVEMQAVSEVVAPPVTQEAPPVVETEMAPQFVSDTAAPAQMAEPAPAKKLKAARLAQGTAKDAGQAKAARPQETGAETAAATKPGAMASVSIAVTPWGEIYLDGVKKGVSPPLDTLQVTAGEHEIEIRNSTFPPYTLSVQLKADEKMKIKHKFVNN